MQKLSPCFQTKEEGTSKQSPQASALYASKLSHLDAGSAQVRE